MTCSPGQYCFDPTGICNQGCTDVSNCANGQFCDLSNAIPDQKGVNFGTCRAPGAGQIIACPGGNDAGGSCGDVHGVYSVTLDTASSSAPCANSFSNTQCTVTQSNCDLTWSCSPNNGFTTSTLDGSDHSTVTIPVPGGTGTCAIVFSSGSFTWDCQFTASNTAVDCNGTGVKQ